MSEIRDLWFGRSCILLSMSLHEINDQNEQVVFNATSKQLASVPRRLLFRIHNVPKARVFYIHSEVCGILVSGIVGSWYTYTLHHHTLALE